MGRRRQRIAAVAGAALTAALLLTSCSGTSTGITKASSPKKASIAPPSRGPGSGRPSSALPPIKHVFLIVFENKSYAETWGPDPGAPYLGTTLRAQGNLLSQYFATSHDSLGNYISMVSGQPANTETQADCVSGYKPVSPSTVVNGIVNGTGCIYPDGVGTIASQLQTAGLTWKGYMDSMAEPCQHPVVNQIDPNLVATPTSLYATRHNPFVYFSAITSSPSCATDDVPLTQMTQDLAKISTTPNYSFITPNLCNDGHDATCAAPGQPAGFAGINSFLQTWVPKILASPAYKKDGLLLITFDEAEAGGDDEDTTACCNEPPSISAQNTQTAMAGKTGPGGGRIGLLALSPFIAPGSTTTTPYNHFSMLRSIEDLFALPHLAEAAAPGLARFGPDVFTKSKG